MRVSIYGYKNLKTEKNGKNKQKPALPAYWLINPAKFLKPQLFHKYLGFDDKFVNFK